MAGPLPLWRSLLYVPVTNQRFVEKASARGADVIKLDLEDSIPPAEKPAARAALRDAAQVISNAGTEVLVRINRPCRSWRARIILRSLTRRWRSWSASAACRSGASASWA